MVAYSKSEQKCIILKTQSSRFSAVFIEFLLEPTPKAVYETRSMAVLKTTVLHQVVRKVKVQLAIFGCVVFWYAVNPLDQLEPLLRLLLFVIVICFFLYI